MPKLIATVGGLVICAGLDLLWQSRLQVRYWVETYAKLLSRLWRRQSRLRLMRSAADFLPRQASLQVLLGLGFAFLLGPLLLVVSLALIFHPLFGPH
jgi:hypothetical protein